MKNDELSMVVTGYAIKWNSWSNEVREDGKAFYERFQKGAFTESLKSINQLALCRHKWTEKVGEVDEKTLFLEEDEVGLAFKIILPESGFGVRTFREVNKGILSKASVCFRNSIDSWSMDNTKQYRTVKKADLVEISLVEKPAYLDTVAKCGEQREQLKILHKIDQAIVDIKKREIISRIKAALN